MTMIGSKENVTVEMTRGEQARDHDIMPGKHVFFH
jgi:hypothetical protein